MPRQHVLRDPMPVLDAFIADDAGRSERGARRNRRPDFHHRAIACAPAGSERLAVSCDTNRGAAGRAERLAGGQPRAGPRCLLLQVGMVTFDMSLVPGRGGRRRRYKADRDDNDDEQRCLSHNCQLDSVASAMPAALNRHFQHG